MKEERETFDLIENYLKGSLAQEEYARVEERIKNDSAFAEQVELAAHVNAVVVGAAMDKLREQMTKDLTGLDKKTKFKWWAGGFLVLLGLTTSTYLYLNDKEQPKTNNTVTSSPISSLSDRGGKAEKEIKSNHGSESITRKVDPEIRNVEGKDTTTKTSDPLIQHQEEILKKEEPAGKNPVIEPVPVHPLTNEVKPVAKCKIQFSPQVFPTCKGESSGRIEISRDAVEGGIAPYLFMLDHSGMENTSGHFSGLSEGKHLISIKDKSGCSATQEVVLSSKPCILHKSFSINPDNGEIWKVPFSDGESGKFTILNKAGIVIFRGIFGNGELSEWNGADLNGTTVNSGLYVCLLEYTSGEKETVQITIIR